VAGSAEADKGFIPVYPDAWLTRARKDGLNRGNPPKEVRASSDSRVSGALVELVIVRP
jgi:hypothetical protein